MPTTLKIKSSKGLKSQFYDAAMKAEQRIELGKLRQPVVERFNKRVNNWSAESKPKFQARVIGTDKGFTFVVIVTGTQKQKNLWAQLDSEGRPRGKVILGKPSQFQEISGKFGPYQARKYLRFKAKYSPKTRPIDSYGGQGKRHGPWVRKKVVIQGAVEPRKFSESIMENYFRAEFRRAARRGYRRAFNRVTSGPQI